MNPEELYLGLIDKERNIYEPAHLFQQNRYKVEEYLENLTEPGTNKPLKHTGKVLKGEGEIEFPINEEVVDFIGASKRTISDEEWERLNAQFLNYHKSLTVYTLINSTPIMNYLGARTGLSSVKDKTIVDIGAGTGQVYASFFKYPETLTYYLVDPNLRLLHDQFLRVYPKLAELKMAHLLAYAEALPFKNEFADMVMTLSAIDHFKDYKRFFEESYRILKPGGVLFVSSHLDIPASNQDVTQTKQKLFSNTFFERLARYFYYKRHQVGHDDHTFHFTNLEPFTAELNRLGYKIEKAEIFKRYFFIVAYK
jgi:ubiquinone/menaquinone biosynthesis C-methylase UbiE